MAHGGCARRRVEERQPLARRSKWLGVDKKRSSVDKKKRSSADKKNSKQKVVTLKNRIRSIERLLRKNLPIEMREAQEKKLKELKQQQEQQQETQTRIAMKRKLQLRYKMVKFYERRKIERMMRRLEKQQRSSVDRNLEEKISEQLSKLKEDLEYVKFFPKTEKYVSLFVEEDTPEIVEKRNKLRKQIKANLMAAAAKGKELEETASDDDILDDSNDDFFLNASSDDEVEADDEWTDKSAREPASCASGKAASGMSSDEKNQRQISARVLMPPPRTLPSDIKRSLEKANMSRSTNISRCKSGSSSRSWEAVNAKRDHNSNQSSNSDAYKHSRIDSSSISWGALNAKRDHNINRSSNSDTYKPRRKRRPKKKKQAG